jgi:ribosomal protein S18 acetylase RimI-like enzyme
MTADYARALVDSRVWVVDGDDRLEAVMVLEKHDDHLLVDVIAVDPAAQGRGVGAVLLEQAEIDARQLGLPELRLYTNAAMTENLAYYPRRGFEETGRRVENGFSRVYYRRDVAPHAS